MTVFAGTTIEEIVEAVAVAEHHARRIAGWACPQCDAAVRILAVGTEAIAQRDGSAEQVGELEWTDDAPCRCTACDWSGPAGEAIGVDPAPPAS